MRRDRGHGDRHGLRTGAVGGWLPADKDAKIVVYCRSDRMSRIAAEVWAEAGYTNLYNLAGGFVAWEEAGYPLLQEDRQ